MLSAIVWLLRNAYENERATTGKTFERHEKQLAELKEENTNLQRALHEQQLTLRDHTSNFKIVDERTQRLDTRDEDQERALGRLKERLDRGDRTASGLSGAARLPREEPTSDPPIPPPRPRLPSRRE